MKFIFWPSFFDVSLVGGIPPRAWRPVAAATACEAGATKVKETSCRGARSLESRRIGAVDLRLGTGRGGSKGGGGKIPRGSHGYPGNHGYPALCLGSLPGQPWQTRPLPPSALGSIGSGAAGGVRRSFVSTGEMRIGASASGCFLAVELQQVEIRLPDGHWEVGQVAKRYRSATQPW